MHTHVTLKDKFLPLIILPTVLQNTGMNFKEFLPLVLTENKMFASDSTCDWLDSV
jgi:hypothetical protein